MGEYDFYHASLRGEMPDRNDGPQPGRYRIPARRTDGEGYRPAKSWPVAIWRENDKTIVMIGRRVLAHGSEEYHAFASSSWHACVAVSQEQYDAVMAGGAWPDEHEAVTRSNQAPPDDTVEAITERIADLAREAQALIDNGAAQSQEDCDRAADLANLIGKLERRADDLREAEKAPVLQQCRDIDARWRTPITAAKNAKDRLKAAVITPFLQALRRRQEAQQFQALTTGTPEHEIPQPKTVAGSRGRPVSLRTVKRAEITDKIALAQASMEHPKLIAALQEIADAAARANITLPGMKIVSEEKAA